MLIDDKSLAYIEEDTQYFPNAEKIQKLDDKDILSLSSNIITENMDAYKELSK